MTIKLVIVLLFLTPQVYSAAPKSFIRQLESEMRTMIKAGDYQNANLLFTKYFDVQRFGRLCLADHWDELSPAEQGRFVELLGGNLRKRMSEKVIFTKDDGDFKLLPMEMTVEKDVIKIANSLKVKKGDFILGVFLVRDKDHLNVIDYDFDGALLSRNYRGSFNYIVRKYGKAGLFERLEKKLSTELSTELLH